MKGKMFRALGVGAALLLPASGVALLTAGTAGAALTQSHVKAKFSFKNSTGKSIGTATCAQAAMSNTIPCTTTGTAGTGTGSISTLKTGATISGKHLLLGTTVDFDITALGTHCTILLGTTVTLTKTTTATSATNGEYVGTATIGSNVTVSPTTNTTCQGVRTEILNGTFHASISPNTTP